MTSTSSQSGLFDSDMALTELSPSRRDQDLGRTASEDRSDRTRIRHLARLILEANHDCDFATLVRGVTGSLVAHRLEVLGDLRRADAVSIVVSVFPDLAEPIERFRTSLRVDVAGRRLQRTLYQEAGKAIGTSSTLAWLYQYLKTPLEEEGTAAAHRAGGEKLAGQRLLHATQFFTEPYMVSYLVGSALPTFGSAEGCLIVDPACGGANFLVDALVELVRRSDDPAVIVDHALRHQLRGYELDEVLGDVGALSLWATASELTWPPLDVRPTIEVGHPNDEVGYLGQTSLGDELDRRPICPKRPMVILTNPPFLGRRLMSSTLRSQLRRRFPIAGNDLAASFLTRCLGQLRAGDRIGIVLPTNWMHLDTFARFRQHVLERAVIEDCADLGPGAFRDLSGEKVRVCLLTLSAAQAPNLQSRFLRLVDLPRAAKARTLVSPPLERIHTVSSSFLAANAVEGIHYHLSDEIRQLLSLGRYGEVARPTQGSSTGDNARWIRPLWLGPADDPEWRLASKGGGYARWAGLSSFRLNWGVQGEALASRSGAALRNAGLVDKMALVFSDTGTRGFSVRKKLPGQIPMASGPGIIVEAGHEAAHLAVLNSRLVSAILRSLSPKLTIAAGYIAKLPISIDVVNDPVLARLGDRCVQLKSRWLSRRIGGAEHSVVNDCVDQCDIEDVITSAILDDIVTEVERLEHEWAIECSLSAHYSLSPRALEFVAREAGICAAAEVNTRICLDVSKVDTFLASALDPSLHFQPPRDVKGLPCDGPIEALALALGAAPAAVGEFLTLNTHGLPRLRERYMDDLLHKVALDHLRFRSDGAWSSQRATVRSVQAAIADRYLWSGDSKGWIEDHLQDVHERALRHAPVIRVADGQVELARHE